MADILHDSSDNLSFSGSSGGRASNPAPSEVNADTPVYICMAEGYRTHGEDRTVYVEEIVSLLGDFLMTNASDEEAREQSEKWDLVARSSKAEWDCLNEEYVNVCQNKAVEGVAKYLKNYDDGPPAFWVMGSNLKTAYDALAKAEIFIKVGDDYWYD
jgi:hypothetical protein